MRRGARDCGAGQEMRIASPRAPLCLRRRPLRRRGTARAAPPPAPSAARGRSSPTGAPQQPPARGKGEGKTTKQRRNRRLACGSDTPTLTREQDHGFTRIRDVTERGTACGAARRCGAPGIPRRGPPAAAAPRGSTARAAPSSRRPRRARWRRGRWSLGPRKKTRTIGGASATAQRAVGFANGNGTTSSRPLSAAAATTAPSACRRGRALSRSSHPRRPQRDGEREPSRVSLQCERLLRLRSQRRAAGAR